MQANLYRTKKARLGSGPNGNGRCRLHDKEVELLRMLVASGCLSRRQASLCFLVTYRHVNRIMSGDRRASEAGPLQKAKRPDRMNRLGYDPTVTIRCECGARTHPSRIDRTKCTLCAGLVGTRK